MSNSSASPHSPMTPFGPAQRNLKPQPKITDKLDELERMPAENRREELLREASRSLYLGLKSLMEAVVLEETKAAPKAEARSEREAGQEAGGTRGEGDGKISSSLAEAMMKAHEEMTQPEHREDATDLDDLEHHPVIQCWPENEVDKVPPVFPKPKMQVPPPPKVDVPVPTPISPFSQSPQAVGKTLPELGLYDPSLTQSKITPMTPPLSLTDLQPAQPEAKSSEDAVPPSPFHVVEDQTGKPTVQTSYLTPQSIPAGDGTPAGANSMTDPLDGEQEIEISQQILSLKKSGNYPFQNTIPASKQQKKAS